MTVNDLRELVRNAMEKNGDSQLALAKRWGVPQSALSRFLSGRAVSADHAFRLVDYVLFSQREASKD